MRRFKSARHAQRFVEVHGIIASHFRPRRHLLSAADYHRLRTTYAATRNFFRSFAVAAREAYLVQLPKGIKTPENGKWVIKVIKWLDIQLLLLEVPFRLRCLTAPRKFLSRCCGCLSTYKLPVNTCIGRSDSRSHSLRRNFLQLRQTPTRDRRHRRRA